jgi:hypothetical protein
MEDQEKEKKAWIDREMSSRDNCDIIIKKRDGIIVNAIVKPILPEIRADFSIFFSEETSI